MANQVAIVTDSVACIPKELIQKYEIEVVPIQVMFGDKAYRDGVDISPSEFYAMLRQAEKLPTTAASLPGPVFEAYRKASERANNILCITISSKLSGMYNSAVLAKEKAKEALPGVTIEVLDSETAAAAQGFVALAAARTATLGRSLPEVVEAAKRVKEKTTFFAALDTLYYLVKGGRVPRAAAWATSILQIKPILTIHDGEVHPVTNSRTLPHAMSRIVKLMEEKVVSGQPLHVAIMHADAPDRAIALREQISARFNCTELFITEFTPVMGAHTGPGVIGVAFYCGD